MLLAGNILLVQFRTFLHMFSWRQALFQLRYDVIYMLSQSRWNIVFWILPKQLTISPKQSALSYLGHRICQSIAFPCFFESSLESSLTRSTAYSLLLLQRFGWTTLRYFSLGAAIFGILRPLVWKVLINTAKLLFASFWPQSLSLSVATFTSLDKGVI